MYSYTYMINTYICKQIHKCIPPSPLPHTCTPIYIYTHTYTHTYITSRNCSTCRISNAPGHTISNSIPPATVTKKENKKIRIGDQI